MGNVIKTPPVSDAYRRHYDSIFGKPEMVVDDKVDVQVERLDSYIDPMMVIKTVEGDLVL